jgi:hypothetical protein
MMAGMFWNGEGAERVEGDRIHPRLFYMSQAGSDDTNYTNEE